MAATLIARPRTRAYKPKARTGCKRCKIRRVKCDETKPCCKRCTTTGRICDGYDPRFVTPRRSPLTRIPPTSTSPPHPNPSQEVVDFASELRSFNAPSFLLPLLRLDSDDERINLQFYMKHAGPTLARSSNSAFWQRQVLQAAHQHASVQHCIIALGAMHRRFSKSKLTPNDLDLPDPHLKFTLQQSNKAIQQLLRDQIESDDTGVVDNLTAMTCCILFGSMANLQGQQKAALDHLRSEPVDIDTNSPWALFELHCRIETLLKDTLALNRSCVVSPATRDDIEHEHALLVTRFQRISNTLDSLRTIAPSINFPANDSSKTMLLVTDTYHWLRSSVEPLQRHFNIISPLSTISHDPVEHFTNMMPHMKHLLSLTSPSTPVYSAAPGLLFALWRIGTSAPSPCIALRREAVELMAKHSRREGMFDGRLAGCIGRIALALEQSAARRELELGEHVEGSG
ncbi:uncharacterized protein M421DRAFT_93772 [Didymella exigua CBS 183.55]|uniref:Zn(2)-C6 fungal-type domain-containing protein n=1 Tax=Didymella exigua CBS 183.55 TaxID=1150837 RepID=A0A6A5RH66_9PLEO|nr:uncharacterized protein M421DRAFT_93772 [Didymella exigua CBS 183.55]KAF1926879.1 hypothetical protein M421DRAFT_93772 [Didymella exigua CBS 183.55]